MLRPYTVSASLTIRPCRKCGERFSGKQCPSCTRARAREWYAANREHAIASSTAWALAHPKEKREGNDRRKRENPAKYRETNRRSALRRYGLTPEQYAAMLAGQRGMCAICAATPKPGKALHVDHDHASGDVRALLCQRCNSLVGFMESPFAQAARDYLTRHR